VRFQLVPAAYVIFRRDDRILLQLRRNTGYRDGFWACAAAGHVEAGETVVEAAVREAREELGVVPDDLTPLTAMHRTGTAEPIDQRVDFFFTCTRWTGEPRRVEEDKSAGIDWFPLDALPENVVPHERFVFDGLREGLPPIVDFGFSRA
jgi:8-oxo-dGTP diphosphatase